MRILDAKMDITESKQTEVALVEANERAFRKYDQLLERLSTLGQKLCLAHDLRAIFNAIHDFAYASVPCSALFISLYDKKQSIRNIIYMWYNGNEMDVSNFKPATIGTGPVGQVIKTGEVVIVNDYQKTLGKKTTNIFFGFDEDDREPRSTIIAPMKIMGDPIGVIEVQSYELAAYTQEHVTAMRMAANLVANAIENVRLLEQERHNAEQLRQAQKLESVGLLAGGIAHDFNNMLTAINGYSDLTLRKLKADDPIRHNIEEIKKAGLRSADLTYQLLAFSRQQVLKPVVTELNEIIAETITLLQRLIGEDIQLITALNPKVGRVIVDPGQFSQVIMNLAVNARDAMPQGGKLAIETANIFLEPSYTQQHPGILSGAYVLTSVSDTGSGMSGETLEHIFDPFFTTKAVGHGTGLGLSTVYGIVKQSGGNIEVSSEVGVGTTFKIYLPRVIGEVEETDIKDISSEMPKGTETIFLVEDEEMVLNLSREILETCGYKVIVARDGLEALKICDSRDHQFDLLMTDVVMPQMGGRELAEKLSERIPNLRILYTSGYTDDAVVRHGVIEFNTNFIQKPFSPDSLANKVRAILDNS